jgi:hypothetical protein
VNPFAVVKKSVFCDIDFELGNLSVNKFYFGEMKTMARPDVNSMVIKTTRKIAEKSLRLFLLEWAPKAYRIKGFVNVKEGKTMAVQCTLENVEIIELDTNYHPTELIALADQFTQREWYDAFKIL